MIQALLLANEGAVATDNVALAILGLTLCVILCGAGSVFGLWFTGSAASGVLAEDPKKFSKVLVLVVLPATQGIYGFVFGIIGMGSIGTVPAMNIVAASLPLMINGFLSAFFQGKTAVNAIYAVAKNDSLSGKLILFPAMIETYAILALVVSILMLSAGV